MTTGWATLLEATATEQARRIRAGEVSSRDLTRLYLDRIARLNPALSAFVETFEQRALFSALRKDAARRRPRTAGALPPFDGVPIGIKDLNFVRLSRARFGMRGMGVWSPVDDRTVARLRAAGFVVLGKLATSELGAMPVTEPDIHPPTRNPWDLRVSPGGSSGGSGAAVAGGLLPIAHGSDGAGSIRIPAALCHLYGFKPSRGRVANAYGMSDRDILYTCGPLARSVEDAAAMLDALVGDARGAGEASFASQIDAPTGPLRVRLVVRNPIATAHPEVRDAVLRTARTLESLGHHVVEADAPEVTLDEFLPIYQKLVSSPPGVRWSRVQPVTRWLGLAGKGLTRAHADAVQQRLTARANEWFDGADVVLSPTVPGLAPAIGAFDGVDPATSFRQAAELGAYTAMFNVTGGPAATLPLAVSSSGLPIGVQLGAAPGDDLRVLQLSRQLERALPWRGRRAPGVDW